MQVHLVDGTYELFRHFYAVPSRKSKKGREVGATGGVLGSILQLIEGGATHVGVATDHIIESFRNDLFAGYKTGAGVDPDLKSQFTLLEEALEAMGVTVWAMVELEADDALASAAAVAARDRSVDQVIICTPDKDLAQCVVEKRVVQLDRRKGEIRDEHGVIERFGVPPSSIPDYLALTGDAADGFPGLRGWGAKSASAVLARYGHIEDIPARFGEWDVKVRGGGSLAATLREYKDEALLYRRLATLRTDAAVGTVASWRWKGQLPSFEKTAADLGVPALADRAIKAAANLRNV